MHMLERFLFVVVHSNGDFKTGRVGCFLMALVITFPMSLREGRECSPMESFLSNYWNGIHCRFFCDIFAE